MIKKPWIYFCNCIEIVVLFWHILLETLANMHWSFSASLMVGQTDDLDHFRQGFQAQSCVRVYHGIPLNRYTTPTHTLLLPPYCSTSPWHTPAFRNPHCRTRTSGAAYQWQRTVGQGYRPIPSTAVSCRDLHTQQRPQFREKPIPLDCTAMMWITTNNLSCLNML